MAEPKPTSLSPAPPPRRALDEFGISKERASRSTRILSLRLRALRAPALLLRRILPAYGRLADRLLGDAIERCATRAAKGWLIAGAHPQTLSFPNMDVVARCARLGNAELLVWLGACGADPAKPGSDNWTPMHHASAKGHASAIHALAAAGADIAAKANHGFTPMIIACKENRVDAIEALCSLGASINDPDARGEPPLLLCSRRGLEEAARTLLAHGARVDLTERRGFQAIHLAASQGYDGICLALIEAGADPDAPGPWSKTPVAIARAEGHASTLALIERALLLRSPLADAPLDPGPRRSARRL